jgi:TolB protein
VLLCAALLACGGDTTEPEPPATGAIRVTVSTTGVDAPTTYHVFVGGRTPIAVGTTGGSAVFGGLLPGAHSVRLDVAPTCQVAGDNPRATPVATGDTTLVAFSVACTAAFGSLRVTTTTTGIDVDPNGYVVRLHGLTIEGKPYSADASAASTGELTVARVPIGDRIVTLSGLAFNCNLVGANRRTIPVAPAETTAVAFDVACGATPQVAYVAGAGTTADIHVSNADGSGDRPVTTHASRDADPAWSPDGARLAFTTERDGNSEIYVVDADGTGAGRLTNDPAADFHPTWSPDGTRIAFASTRFGAAEILVMNADGSNVVRLTSHHAADDEPAWSPDGQRIAFTSDRDGRDEVYAMDTTGAAVARVTHGGGRQPAWSPDGGGLAYVAPDCSGYYSCLPSIFVAVGTKSATRLVVGGERPAWSPDGRRIAADLLRCDFYGYKCDPDGIHILTLDGIDVIRALSGRSAAWRPRGRP